MPGIDGVAATRRLRETVPDTAVLVLTMYDDDATVFTAMQAGARGYLLKGAEQDEIADAIRAVVRGQAIFGPGIASRLLEHFANPPAPAEEPVPRADPARARDPRAARRGTAYRRDRGHPPPLAEDRLQQPDHHLRQARGGRPHRGGDPGPRARPGRLSRGAVPAGAGHRDGVVRRQRRGTAAAAPGDGRRDAQPARRAHGSGGGGPARVRPRRLGLGRPGAVRRPRSCR